MEDGPGRVCIPVVAVIECVIFIASKIFSTLKCAFVYYFSFGINLVTALLVNLALRAST